jgi:hypothetical protein
MDRNIIGTLSSYEHLTPLQLWYELGEDDAIKEKPTEGELQSRLESLTARGLVERTKRERGDRGTGYLVYRVPQTGRSEEPKMS